MIHGVNPPECICVDAVNYHTTQTRSTVRASAPVCMQYVCDHARCVSTHFFCRLLLFGIHVALMLRHQCTCRPLWWDHMIELGGCLSLGLFLPSNPTKRATAVSYCVSDS